MRSSDTAVFANSPGSIPATWVGSIDFARSDGDGDGDGAADGSADGDGDVDAERSGDGEASGAGDGVGSMLALGDGARDALGATLAASDPAHPLSVRQMRTAIAKGRPDRRIGELLSRDFADVTRGLAPCHAQILDT